MLSLAVLQVLKAEGFQRLRVGGFIDYNNDVAFAINDFPGGDEGLYGAGLQVRSRAPDAVSAVMELERVYDAIIDLRYTTIPYVDPLDTSRNRDYDIRWIEPIQRPTYIPTPTPGEEATVNFRLYVREP